MVAGVGIVAWRLSRDVPEGRKQEVWDTKAQVVGWMSAFLYCAFFLPSSCVGWPAADGATERSGISRTADRKKQEDRLRGVIVIDVCLLRGRERDLRSRTSFPSDRKSVV